jgi:hypothetical protein
VVVGGGGMVRGRRGADGVGVCVCERVGNSPVRRWHFEKHRRFS